MSPGPRAAETVSSDQHGQLTQPWQISVSVEVSALIVVHELQGFAFPEAEGANVDRTDEYLEVATTVGLSSESLGVAGATVDHR